MKIFLPLGKPYTNPIKYLLDLISKNQDVKFEIVFEKNNADFVISDDSDSKFPLALWFYELLSNKEADFNHLKIMPDDKPEIKTESGKVDLLATIFYLVNCLQEKNYSQENLDEYDRFPYEASLQKRFGIIEKNLVQDLINNVVSLMNLNPREIASRLILSHDIDLVNSGWKAMVFKREFYLFFKHLISFRSVWDNIPSIIDLHKRRGFVSTYYWITKKGRDPSGIRNADYRISSKEKELELIYESDSLNGLHKSTLDYSFKEELSESRFVQNHNRYHFLKFQPHRDWPILSDSSIKTDASLGFVNHYGFRNNFGSAFQPYDFRTETSMDIILIPMVFMDGTYTHKMKKPIHNLSKDCIDFLKSNTKNCTFSILWHNTSLSPVTSLGYVEAYEKILDYLESSAYEIVLPSDI